MFSQLQSIVFNGLSRRGSKIAALVSISTAVGIIIVRQFNIYFKWGWCKNNRLLTGKTVIITGGSSGIGKETAKQLAKRNARVILACRNLALGQQAIDEIRKSVKTGELSLRLLDLASFSSIREFAKDILESQPKIDVLINNAGVYGCPYSLTDDGFETQLGVNHLGHFLLTVLLMNRLKESRPSKVLIISSSLYKYGSLDLDFLKTPEQSKYTNDRRGYSNSKFANVLFARELAKKLDSSGVYVYCICPGMVWTNLARHVKFSYWKMILLMPLVAMFVKRPIEGCQTILHCVTVDDAECNSGGLYKDCKEAKYSTNALDDRLCQQLWQVSSELTCCQ